MRFRLIPRDEGFFPLFNDSAEVVATCAPLVEQLLATLPARADLVEQVIALERRGDDVTRDLSERLDRAIITPFDREDIHTLVSALDDVLDELRDATELARLHNVEDPLAEVKGLSAAVSGASAAVQRLVGKLSKLRDLRADLDEVYRLEREGDDLYRRSMAILFSGSFDALTVLKWKDVIEALERALNGLEDVARVVEALSYKHG